MTRKTQIGVYITALQDLRLRALCERSRLPMAEFVREGLELVLAKYEVAPAGYELGEQAKTVPEMAPANDQQKSQKQRASARVVK